MSVEALREEFESNLAKLPGSEDERELRRRAMEEFQCAGFPDRRQENWRYTDLKPISSATFDPLPAQPAQRTHARAEALIIEHGLDAEALRLVFLDGHYVARLSSKEVEPGLGVATLEEAWQENRRALSKGSSERHSGHPLAALNAAFALHGVRIQAAENARIERALHVVFIDGDLDDRAPQPRVVIDVGAQANLTVVQHFLGDGDNRGWTNLVTEITQSPRSKLELYHFQEHGTEHLHTGLVSAKLAEGASIKLGIVDLGGRLIRNDIHVDLCAPGASTELFGVFFASDGQHVDNHTRIDHSAPRTNSHEAFRSIIGDRGRGVFNGKVVVHPKAQKVDARQSSDNLLLSDRGEIDTKPELEIYADDVKCSHGATVGELDEEQLFYLKSRGIDDTTARGLLTFAFVNEVLTLIGQPRLRERVASRVTGHLPAHEQWEALL